MAVGRLVIYIEPYRIPAHSLCTRPRVQAAGEQPTWCVPQGWVRGGCGVGHLHIAYWKKRPVSPTDSIGWLEKPPSSKDAFCDALIALPLPYGPIKCHPPAPPGQSQLSTPRDPALYESDEEEDFDHPARSRLHLCVLLTSLFLGPYRLERPPSLLVKRQSATGAYMC